MKQPALVAGAPVRPAVPGDHNAPGNPPAGHASRASPLAGLVARAGPPIRGVAPQLIAGSLVSSFAADLPRAPARQRQALLAFAIEERIAVPLADAWIAELPAPRAAAGQAVALVMDPQVPGDLAQGPGQAQTRLLPEYLMIPRPAPAADGAPAWAVWCEAARAVVRVSDGTGFAVTSADLTTLWSLASQPALDRLAGPLPPVLERVLRADLSDAPPPPDRREAAFAMPLPGEETGGGAWWRLLPFAAAATCAALAVGLALLAVDTRALGQVAETERQQAQTAIAARLPGVTLGRNTRPVLARLAPDAPVARGGAFLPMLSRMSAALGQTNGTGLRRLAWGKADGTMTLRLQAPDLETLQAGQAALTRAGFGVRAGAASAGAGVAEADLRLTTRPATQ